MFSEVIVLSGEKQAELIVKKSRFLAIAKKCSDINDVKRLIKETREKHPNANHVVHAAVIGTEFSFSDDKEPKGTAGRPAFEVLKGSGISNICVLIVRYFGGTLLGTGGLVKAYGDAVKLVLEGIETEEYVEKICFALCAEYTYCESIKRLLPSVKAVSQKESYDNGISISGLIPVTEKDNLVKAFTNLTKGSGTIVFKVL